MKISKGARLFLLLIILASFEFAYSKTISLEFLNSKPKSIYKDYYIWRYLDQNISSETAFNLIGSVKNMNMRLFLKFAKKIDEKAYKKIRKCYLSFPINLLKKDADCIKIGLSLYGATKLSKKERKTVIKKVRNIYPHYAKLISILNTKDPFITLIKSDQKTFFDIFNYVGKRYRREFLDRKIPKKYIKYLSKNKRFNKTIIYITTDLKLKNLPLSLLDIDGSELNANSNFYLAMNAVRFHSYKNAERFLQTSLKKYRYRFDKDKSLFWLYQITKKDKFLKKLSDSFDINIYTLFAYETLKKTPKNIRYDIECIDKKSSIDIKDPFVWLGILKKIHSKKYDLIKLENGFNSCEELPYKTFILQRLYFKNYNYFILPYKRYLKEYSPDMKALIASIARQESLFIPATISYAYALGMMQFMPFLSKAIAKKKGLKNFDIDDMFDPKISYDFAFYHISYLKKRLKHPLFIAYAYNGGIGFTKRLLKSGLYFKKNRDFEPFFSMEMVPNSQSRKYAKKVLSNYIIYKNIFNEKITLKTLCQTLIRTFDEKNFLK